jgi:glycosyltransferase involved in cell wall biosynthesis
MPKRIAILWTSLSGFMDSCINALESKGASVFFAYQRKMNGNAPYDHTRFGFNAETYGWDEELSAENLRNAIEKFKPDVIIAAGWGIPGYRKVLTEFRARVPRVICMDNQWRGTLKQYVAVFTRKMFFNRLCDAVWVPGERQVRFANRLGYTAERILQGMYTCESARFSPGEAVISRDRKFLFVGRYVSSKGISTLAKAYAEYRATVNNPWPLECAGSGPMRDTLVAVSGITVHDFIQPEDLPRLFLNSTCFISTSLFEPWGVVIHEAAVSGLVILATSEVGASVHLVRDSVNGFLFRPGDQEHLVRLMVRISSATDAELEAMSRASRLLGAQYSPTTWASTLYSRFPDLQAACRS